MRKIDPAGAGSLLVSIASFAGSIAAFGSDRTISLGLAAIAFITGVPGAFFLLRKETATPPREVVQKHVSGSPVAKTGDNAVVQQGGRNVVVTGGTYNEALVRTHKEDDGRIFVNLPPEQLCDIYQNRMAIEADRIFDRYRGKWLRLSGSVADINMAISGRTFLFFQNPYVMMVFIDENQRESLCLARR